MLIIRAILCLAMLFAAPSWLPAEDWPQFRGPNATGIAAESDDLPVKFSSDERVLWSAKLGEGIASPVVSRGRVIVTAMEDTATFAVTCFDARSGRPRWRRQWKTGALPEIMPPNVHASSTPATDGESVYVYFSTLGLQALDLETGDVLWKQPVDQPFYLMGWGAAHSPIVYQDTVYLNQDDDLSPFLLAVDKRSGKIRWRSPRPEMLAGYALPVVCRADGRVDIVVAGTGKLQGYDPATGRVRWSSHTLLRTVMTTPAVQDGVIYVSIQSYGDTNRVLKYALLQWKDTNQDGKLEKSELDQAFWKKFDRADADRDGYLVDAEIDAAFQSSTNMVGGGTTVQAVRGGGTGDVTATHVLWNLDNKAPSNIVSPLVISDRVFVVKKGGISASFDRFTGEAVWIKKRIGNFGNYYASPVAGDGKIYVMGENGYMVVLRDAPRVERLAKNDFGESCLATPAIADNRMFVRTMQHLYCVSNEVE